MRPREVHGRTWVERPSITELPPRPYLPDRELTFYRHGVRWSFTNGKIMMDGHDINQLMMQHPSDVGLWMAVAQGLDDYRKRMLVLARELDQFARFQAIVEALLVKILGKLKKIYDQKMSGLSWELENGQLILNGINVRSFLALYRLRKTEKAKKFLKGLRGKLAYLLENRHASPDYERIREVVGSLYQEMDDLLASEETPRGARSLLPAGAHAS